MHEKAGPALRPNMEELRSAIGSIENSGSFAYSAYDETPCNPGLSIEGYGSVGLSLSS